MSANWHRVDEVDVPADGRVRSVVVDRRSLALARCDDVQGAGPGSGHASARRRRPRPQRYTGRQLADGRGYLGSIGFGYPAALGAWAGAPGRPIVAVTGDGGFGQYAAELTTAVKYGIPIKHVLLDNHSLGKISKEQLAADYPVWHTSLRNPDWAAYGELCGATGLRVVRPGQLDDAMTELFAAPEPVLLCVEQDAELF